MEAMASVVPHLIAHLGASLSDIIFVTDAMCVGRDCGGWGVVAADIDLALALQSFRLAHQPGKAVCKLSGDYAGERDSSTPFLRKVPFTRLPPTFVVRSSKDDVGSRGGRPLAFPGSYRAWRSASRGACDSGSRSLPSLPLHHGYGRMHDKREEPFAGFELLMQTALRCYHGSPVDFGAAMDGDESYAS